MKVYYDPYADGAKSGVDTYPCLYSFDTDKTRPLYVLIYLGEGDTLQDADDLACSLASDMGWGVVTHREDQGCRDCIGGSCDAHTLTSSGYTSRFNHAKRFASQKDWLAYRKKYAVDIQVIDSWDELCRRVDARQHTGEVTV